MIRLSIGNSRMEKHWNLVEMELSEFRDRISHHPADGRDGGAVPEAGESEAG